MHGVALASVHSRQRCKRARSAGGRGRGAEAGRAEQRRGEWRGGSCGRVIKRKLIRCGSARRWCRYPSQADVFSNTRTRNQSPRYGTLHRPTNGFVYIHRRMIIIVQMSIQWEGCHLLINLQGGGKHSLAEFVLVFFPPGRCEIVSPVMTSEFFLIDKC